jgi:two-component system response regulator HydG
MANKSNGKNARRFTSEVTRWMFNYHWTGNIRQLKNVVESMVVLDMDNVLDMDDLSPDLTGETGAVPAPATSVAAPAAGPVDAASSLIGKTMDEIERWAYEQTLLLTGGNREETARILGVSERTLYRKIGLYKLA